MELLRKHLLREGHINKPELMELIAAAVKIMSKSTVHYSNNLSEMDHLNIFLTNLYINRKRAKRNQDQRASYYRRRYPRLILRYDPHVREGGRQQEFAKNKHAFLGRLRGSRKLLNRSMPFPVFAENKFPVGDHAAEGKPRVGSDDGTLHFPRGGASQVRR